MFLGGDTDTIACMTGALSGAFLGADRIPVNWLNAVKEDDYTPTKVQCLAESLWKKNDMCKDRI